MKIVVSYPPIDEEKIMVEKILAGSTGAELSVDGVETVPIPGGFTALRDFASGIRTDPAIIDYAVRLTAATRTSPAVQTGAGPRGSLALIRCARAKALIEGRNFVIPDDIKSLARPVLAHRLTFSAESELEGLNEERIIAGLLSKTEAPRT
jgi:MoxR-like ATPase